MEYEDTGEAIEEDEWPSADDEDAHDPTSTSDVDPSKTDSNSGRQGSNGAHLHANKNGRVNVPVTETITAPPPKPKGDVSHLVGRRLVPFFVAGTKEENVDLAVDEDDGLDFSVDVESRQFVDGFFEPAGDGDDYWGTGKSQQHPPSSSKKQKKGKTKKRGQNNHNLNHHGYPNHYGGQYGGGGGYQPYDPSMQPPPPHYYNNYNGYPMQPPMQPPQMNPPPHLRPSDVKKTKKQVNSLNKQLTKASKDTYSDFFNSPPAADVPMPSFFKSGSGDESDEEYDTDSTTIANANRRQKKRVKLRKKKQERRQNKKKRGQQNKSSENNENSAPPMPSHIPIPSFFNMDASSPSSANDNSPQLTSSEPQHNPSKPSSLSPNSTINLLRENQDLHTENDLLKMKLQLLEQQQVIKTLQQQQRPRSQTQTQRHAAAGSHLLSMLKQNSTSPAPPTVNTSPVNPGRSLLHMINGGNNTPPIAHTVSPRHPNQQQQQAYLQQSAATLLNILKPQQQQQQPKPTYTSPPLHPHPHYEQTPPPHTRLDNFRKPPQPSSSNSNTPSQAMSSHLKQLLKLQ